MDHKQRQHSLSQAVDIHKESCRLRMREASSSIQSTEHLTRILLFGPTPGGIDAPNCILLVFSFSKGPAKKRSCRDVAAKTFSCDRVTSGYLTASCLNQGKRKTGLGMALVLRKITQALHSRRETTNTEKACEDKVSTPFGGL